MPRFTVRATRLGFYGGGRRRPGDPPFVVEVQSRKQLGSWMEVVSEEPSEADAAVVEKSSDKAPAEKDSKKK